MTTSTTATRRGRPPTISLDEIVTAATQIAESEGLERVSLRGVASSIGVSAVALYRYVESVDDLMDQVVNRIIDSFDPTQTRRLRRLPPHERGVAFALALYALVRTHPVIVQCYQRRQILTLQALDAIEPVLEGFKEAGLDGPRASELYGAIHSFVVGYSSMEVGRSTLTDAQREFRRHQLAETFDASAGRHPLSACAAEDMTRFFSSPEVVERAIGALLIGHGVLPKLAKAKK